MKKLTFDRRALARVFTGLKHYRLALAASLLLAAAVVALTLYVPLLLPRYHSDLRHCKDHSGF